MKAKSAMTIRWLDQRASLLPTIRGRQARPCQEAGAQCGRFVLLGGVILLLSLVGCAARPPVKPTPDTARQELALRGISFNEREFLDVVRDGRVGMVKLFLTAGMNPNARDEQGETALAVATAKDHLEIVRALLEAKADANLTGRDGLTPLMRAVRDGKKGIARALLDGGADINSRSPVNGATALMYAAWNDDREMLRMLLDGGARIEARDNNGLTPLHWAAFMGNVEMTRTLLDGGADVNARNDVKGTALMIAAAKGRIDVVRLLLERGADPRLRDWRGKDAVWWAEQGRHQEIAQLIRQAARKSPTGSRPTGATASTNSAGSEHEQRVNEYDLGDR